MIAAVDFALVHKLSGVYKWRSVMQTLIFGLTFGGIYALMSLAINVIYSTTRIMNFAHAMVITFSAMLMRHLHMIMGMPLGLSLLITISATMILNLVTYKICIEPCGDLMKNNIWVITTFGINHILENSCRIVFGTETYPFPYLFNGAKVTIGGTGILWHEILMFAVAIVIGIAYQTMMNRTRFGRSLRAVAWKPDTALLMGINSKAVIMICFAISGAIAAVAAMLLAPVTYVSFNMTANIGLKAYAATLIGGLGNTKGALIGGFILGIIECILGTFVSAAMRDAITFVIMILVIIFLPGGVMSAKIFNKGRSATEKV